MEKSRLLYLLQRYEKQELTVEETQELEYWYQQQLSGDPQLFEEPGARAAQQVLLTKIQHNLHPVQPQQAVIYAKTFWWVSRAAAVILLVVSARLLLFPGRNNQEQAVTAVLATATPVAATTITIENTTRKPIVRYLPDSSFIQLSAGSTLKYPADYGAVTRELHLNGECYFDVRQDARHPFTVHSNGISTTALGTSFTVQALNNKNTVTVKLLTGKVVISRRTPSTTQLSQVYLKPGQSFLWNELSNLVTVLKPSDTDTKNRQTTVQKQHTPSVTGFEKNYDRVSLPELLNDLATAYHVHIDYTAIKLNDMQFSGMVSKTDSLATVFRRIGILNNLTIEQTAKNEYRIITNNP